MALTTFLQRGQPTCCTTLNVICCCVWEAWTRMAASSESEPVQRYISRIIRKNVFAICYYHLLSLIKQSSNGHQIGPLPSEINCFVTTSQRLPALPKIHASTCGARRASCPARPLLSRWKSSECSCAAVFMVLTDATVSRGWVFLPLKNESSVGSLGLVIPGMDAIKMIEAIDWVMDSISNEMWIETTEWIPKRCDCIYSSI